MKRIEGIGKLLDENLGYVKHEVAEDRRTIWVKSAKSEKEKFKLVKKLGNYTTKITQKGKYQNY